MGSWKSKIAKTFRRARKFRDADHSKRALAIEACIALCHARIVTLMTASVYTRCLGDLGEETHTIDPSQEMEAAEIGKMVAVIAKAMPFRAVCLQQAIATRRMLRRRGIAACVNLGMSSSAIKEPIADHARSAHAWVVAGKTIINGDLDVDLENYVVVARFY